MGAIVWLIVAAVLAVLELAAGEFTLLMLAGGALATVGIAVFDVPIWAEVLTFAVSSIGLLVFLRPYLKKRLHRPQALDTSPKALVGHSAEVLEEIGAGSGQIRLEGSIWSARALDPTTTFAVGEHVTVISIDGPTAVVWKEP